MDPDSLPSAISHIPHIHTFSVSILLDRDEMTSHNLGLYLKSDFISKV